jgi:hypothetical protein
MQFFSQACTQRPKLSADGRFKAIKIQQTTMLIKFNTLKISTIRQIHYTRC